MDPRLPARQLAPVAPAERIAALDVVRGFALIGILIMNVEFFNRASAENGAGIALGLSGLDLWVSYFVAYFVIGKFWTIFSLLFGMGFGVMLTRAEAAGRPFLKPYLRRIAALAVLGALHHIFLWSGDILYSYAVAACALLVVLFVPLRYLICAVVVISLAALLTGKQAVVGTALASVVFCFAAAFLRSERQLRIGGASVPLVALVAAAIGVVLSVVAAGAWLMPQSAREARLILPVVAFNVLCLSALMAKYQQPAAARPWRLGVGIYVFLFYSMCSVGAVQYYFPAPAAISAEAKQVDAKAEQARQLQEKAADIANENRVLKSGSYREVLAMRTAEFAEHAPRALGFAAILVGLFMLGVWFVRSGIMSDTRAHLPLFRKLALYGLPIGLGLGLLGAMIATSHLPGADNDGWQFARNLLMLGNLPACLGYVSLVIMLLHSDSPGRHLRLLAPFGRMALTNYLCQSLIASTFFFGYGFGFYGIARSWQMVYVLAVLLLQIPLSHWWLARFRYGPAEWLWRAFTYWQWPPMRLAPAWHSAPGHPSARER